MVKEIPLQNGMVALVDDEDFERVKDIIWTVSATSRGVSIQVLSGEKNLSRTVLGLSIEDKRLVTFKDKNQLNFQKENLILTDKLFVLRNRFGARNSSSIYKGVSWDKERNKWSANIKLGNKKKYLGRFDREEEAAKAYNEAVMKYLDGNGYLNVIGEDNRAKKFEIEKRNVHRKRKGKSGFRGVCKQWNRWGVYIQDKYLTSCETVEKAAKVYDQKAYEIYGDKAILNFPELIDEYKKALKEVKPITIKPVPVALVSQAINKALSARQK